MESAISYRKHPTESRKQSYHAGATFIICKPTASLILQYLLKFYISLKKDIIGYMLRLTVNQLIQKWSAHLIQN